MSKESLLLDLLCAYVQSRNILPILFKDEYLRDITIDELKALVGTTSGAFVDKFTDGFGSYYNDEKIANREKNRVEANLKTIESFINHYKTGELIKFYHYDGDQQTNYDSSEDPR